MFDYPILGPEGDAGSALAAIEQYCGDKELPLVLSVVPEDKASQLVLRYPRVTVISERPWKDYLYHTEDLAQFAGRRYSGQRNHINKFRRDYPDAAFVALTDPNDPRLTAFWADYEAEFHKTGPLAKQELALAQEMFSLLDTGWFCAGGMLAEGRLAVSYTHLDVYKRQARWFICSTKASTEPATASPRMLHVSLAEITSIQYSSCSTVSVSPTLMSAVLPSSTIPFMADWVAVMLWSIRSWPRSTASSTSRALMTLVMPVSYTHLDVYKRQGLYDIVYQLRPSNTGGSQTRNGFLSCRRPRRPSAAP